MSRVIPFPVLAAVPDEYSAPAFPVPLHDAVAASRRRHRGLIVAAGRWALAHGVPIPADHVALWAASVDDLSCTNGIDGVIDPWRASAVPDFLDTIAAWCAVAGCSVPGGFAESLWHLFGFLADTGRLHPASDPLIELRASVVVLGAFDRFRPLPSRPPEPTAA